MDLENVNKLIEECDESTKALVEVSDKIVDGYCSSLDDIMQNIYREIVISDEPIDTEEVITFFGQLTGCVYFISDKAETLGLYADSSKASAKEVYNISYLNNQAVTSDDKKKKTVNELTALAEAESIDSTAMAWVYNRSWKRVCAKVEAAQTMIATLSKILSKRMQDNDFDNRNVAGNRILLENT